MLLSSSLPAQVRPSSPQVANGNSSILQQRYDKAQQLQAANNLPGAAQEYRIFIADALGEIAVGLAQAHDFNAAANNFDEALRLVPQFPLLRLQYARAGLQAGKDERAKLEAQKILASPAIPNQVAAGAHEVLGRLLLKQDQDAEAKKELEQAVALDSTFENGYELAVADLNLGDAKGAATLFGEMLKSYGDQPRMHLYFGQAYANSDFQAQAMAEFKQALARDPRLPGLHYSLAAAYVGDGEGHLKEAETELRQEIALAPDNALALAAVGHILALEAGGPEHMQEAEKDLERATQLDPTAPDAFFYLGQFYSEANRPADAIAALRKAIALTTDSPRNASQMQKAHYLLGRLLIKSGQSEEGKAELATSQEFMQRNLHRDQARLSEYLDNKQTSKASAAVLTMPDAVSAPAQNPDDARRVQALQQQLTPAIADAYNNLGAIAAGSGDYRGAVLAFQRAAEWKPELPGLDYNWGRAAFAAGMVRDAVGPLQRYLRVHPDDDGARSVLGLCLFQEKNFPETRDVLAPLASKSDTAAQVRFAYADSLVETGNVAEGTAKLEELSKAAPKEAEIHRALGKAYGSRNPSAATNEYKAALQINPDDVDSLTSLAELELVSGNVADGQAHLKRALRLQPNNVALQQRLTAANRQTAHP